MYDKLRVAIDLVQSDGFVQLQVRLDRARIVLLVHPFHGENLQREANTKRWFITRCHGVLRTVIIKNSHYLCSDFPSIVRLNFELRSFGNVTVKIVDFYYIDLVVQS